MKRFFLEAAAKRQIESIWDYTKETWGVRQAEKYTNGLLLHCEKLSLKKLPWQSHLIHGKTIIYRSRYEKHLIFFKKTIDGKLSILAIFHISMDVPQHLVRYIGE
jgi:plasmid stabilization system protein ParE